MRLGWNCCCFKDKISCLNYITVGSAAVVGKREGSRMMPKMLKIFLILFAADRQDSERQHEENVFGMRRVLSAQGLLSSGVIDRKWIEIMHV